MSMEDENIIHWDDCDIACSYTHHVPYAIGGDLSSSSDESVVNWGVLNHNTYHLTSQCFSTINREDTFSIISDSQFDRILFDGLRELLYIDSNQDRCEFKNLKKYIMKKLNNFFNTFINRGIIENFNIIGICDDFEYIKVKFNILRRGELVSLIKMYRYESKNYGLR